MGMAIGIIPVKTGSLHAPTYIVFIAGLLFWIAGVSILIGSTRPRFNSLLAAILFALFAVIGGWVSLFGTSNAFGGGVPFAPHSTNEWIARVMFGAGAIVCVLCCIYALAMAVRSAD